MNVPYAPPTTWGRAATGSSPTAGVCNACKASAKAQLTMIAGESRTNRFIAWLDGSLREKPHISKNSPTSTGAATRVDMFASPTNCHRGLGCHDISIAAVTLNHKGKGNENSQTYAHARNSYANHSQIATPTTPTAKTAGANITSHLTK
ncbi:MAG TPA: hypothetical protein VFO38_06095 [Candidatus Saccharimonadales bacterium]|nr:hypothetical protein [Candidatus Saccharimonadales bacterium]